MAGISIPFLANVSRFLRGTKDVVGGVESVGDSLSDLARESKVSARQVGGNFDDVAREASDAADRIADDYRDAFRAAAKSSTAATGDITTDAKRSMRGAGEATDTFAKEAKNNLSETVSSFRGDAEDIPQIFQDVLGGVVADLGPAGVIGGALGAAGIGLAVALFQKSAERAAELKEDVIDLANEIADAGGRVNRVDWATRFREFGNEIADAKSWFEPWQKEALTNFEVVKRAADELGLNYERTFRAMAGDTEQAAELLPELRDRIASVTAEMDDYNRQVGTGTEWHGRSYRSILDELAALEGLTSELEAATGQTEDAIELEKLISDAYAESAAGIAEKNELMAEAAELTRDVIDSELDYLDAVDEVTAALDENAAKGFDKNTAAGRDNLRQLGTLADATLGYADALEEQAGSSEAANVAITQGRDDLVRLAQELGMTRREAETYADKLGLIPRNVTTEVTADTASARTALDKVSADRTAMIVADFSEFDQALARRRPVITATVRAGRIVV